MSDFKSKPLNPSARVIDGRLGGVNYFMSRVFGDVAPNFAEYIKVEDRVNAVLKCEFKDDLKVNCLMSSMFKNGWSLMRTPGFYSGDDVIVMLGMASREENDKVPRRVFVFRISDVDTTTIQTKVGEREATFFSMDKQDQWCQFASDARDGAMVIRSLIERTVDPDITDGPFKSYLRTIIEGTSAPAPSAQAPQQQPADDWDQDIPF